MTDKIGRVSGCHHHVAQPLLERALAAHSQPYVAQAYAIRPDTLNRSTPPVVDATPLRTPNVQLRRTAAAAAAAATMGKPVAQDPADAVVEKLSALLKSTVEGRGNRFRYSLVRRRNVRAAIGPRRWQCYLTHERTCCVWWPAAQSRPTLEALCDAIDPTNDDVLHSFELFCSVRPWRAHPRAMLPALALTALPVRGLARFIVCALRSPYCGTAPRHCLRSGSRNGCCVGLSCWRACGCGR